MANRFVSIRFSICSFVLAIMLPSMALGFDQTHLHQLKHTKACPGCDLSGLNLTGAHLKEADLSGANLAEAKLAKANLVRADLWEAMMLGAKFCNTTMPNGKNSQVGCSP